MKRIGYTLAEALIAMAIVAIVTALMLPMASKFTPDVNKAMYLKTYDAIVNATHSITESVELSPVLNDPAKDNINYSTYPLFNTSAKSTFDGVTYGGDNSKYCKLLALSLGGNPSGCSAQYSAVPNWNAPSFTTKNGAAFCVYTNSQLLSSTTATYQSDVYFDVDGVGKGNDCSYNASTCTDPDRFKLIVGAGGDVHIADEKGVIHSQKRGNWRLNRDELGGDVIAFIPTFEVDLIKDIVDEESKDEEPGGDEDDGIEDLGGDFKDEADKGSEEEDQSDNEHPDCGAITCEFCIKKGTPIFQAGLVAPGQACPKCGAFREQIQMCKDNDLLDPTKNCQACIWIDAIRNDPDYSHCFREGEYSSVGWGQGNIGLGGPGLSCAHKFIHTCGKNAKP